MMTTVQFSRSRAWLVPALAFAIAVSASTAAKAAVILTFGQSVNGTTVVATNSVVAGINRTTINGTNIPITISQFGGPGAPINAFLNFSLVSTSPAQTTILPGPTSLYTEAFSGNAKFTSAMGGAGINYLSSTFVDSLFAIKGASSLTIAASDPPATNVSFASSVLTAAQLQDPRALSFSFADVSPVVGLFGSGANVTLRAFRSSISGTVSAADLPEPMSAALLAGGLLLLAAYRRRNP